MSLISSNLSIHGPGSLTLIFAFSFCLRRLVEATHARILCPVIFISST